MLFSFILLLVLLPELYFAENQTVNPFLNHRPTDNITIQIQPITTRERSIKFITAQSSDADPVWCINGQDVQIINRSINGLFTISKVENGYWQLMIDTSLLIDSSENFTERLLYAITNHDCQHPKNHFQISSTNVSYAYAALLDIREETQQCPVVPTCQTLSLENGAVEYPLMELSKSVAFFSCHGGYELVGESYVTCLQSEEWSDDTPTCEPIRKCNPLTDLDSQHSIDYIFDGNVTSTDEFSKGTIAVIHCGGGYELQGEPYRQCLSDGSWSNMETTCRAIPQCVQLSLSEGHIIEYWFNGINVTGQSENQYYEGTIAVISCADGHELKGTPVKQCLSGGSWTNMEAMCTKIPTTEQQCSTSSTSNTNTYSTGTTDIQVESDGALGCSPPGIIVFLVTGLASGVAVSILILTLAWLVCRVKKKNKQMEPEQSSESIANQQTDLELSDRKDT